jgi:hypothetical protein
MRILLPFFLLLFISSALRCYAQDTTNKGTEFWVGYGHHQFMEDGTNTQNMAIYLETGSQAATVVVTIDSSGNPPFLPVWKRTFNIPINTFLRPEFLPKGVTDAGPSGTSASYDARLYTSLPQASTGIFRKKGIHIESNVPITVYVHIYGSVSAGASMLLPVQAWGYQYTSVNSKQSYNPNSFSWAYVIAKEDSTVVEIKPSTLTRAQDVSGLQPGVAKTIVLNKGWIYQLLGANDGADANGNGGTTITAKELTATTVRSLSPGKPITVFSGSSRTSNPATCGFGGGDNDIGQLFPLHTWGRTYLTAPVMQSTSDAAFATTVYKVVVKDPATIIRRNGVQQVGLTNSMYYIFESNTADFITADKPIMVGQFLLGGLCVGTGGSVGDPDMVYLSPIDAGLKSVKTMRLSPENISLNYITVILPTNGVSSLRIGGSSTFNANYPHTNFPGYSVVTKKWAATVPEQIDISCDSAFTGISYGLGNAESYAVNIGAKFNQANGVDPNFPMRWIGTISDDWNTAGNWSTGRVPTAEDNVLIPQGTPFSPTIQSGIVSVNTLTVSTGAVLAVKPGAKLVVLH